MNLIEQLKTCRQKTFEWPEVPEVLYTFGDVMGHGSDSIEYVYVDEENQTFTVKFVWGCRGSCCDEHYTAPLSILYSDDVKKATFIWRLSERRKEILGDISRAKSSLVYEEEQLSLIDEALSRWIK